MQKRNSHTNESKLVSRLIDGDEKAFCELYAVYRERLFFFVLKFLKSDEYAEDILQDVFTNIWLGRRLINPDIPFSAYIYAIVRNRVLNEIRDMEKRHSLREHLLQHAVDYTDAPQNEIISKDLKDIIQKAYDSMTIRQQEIFRLSREGQLSYKEIADKLGISANTVHEHITASLHIMRRFLMKYSETNVDILLLFFCLNV